MGTAGHAVGSAVRSTSFLAAFVGIYSAAISLHRKLFSCDHKLLYYVAGNQLLCMKQALLQRSDCTIQYSGVIKALAPLKASNHPLFDAFEGFGVHTQYGSAAFAHTSLMATKAFQQVL